MIREYRESDWLKVQELYKEALDHVYGHDGIASPYPAEIKDAMFYPLDRDKIVVGIVVGEKDEVDGYILGQQYAPGICAIDEIYFRPHIRGTVFFGKAADAFERLAKARGFKYLLASSWASHNDLRHLIARKGYKEMNVTSYKEL